MTEQQNIIPFGKYKGRAIDEVLLDDPSYLQWLTQQDWFRAKFVVLHQTIINRGAEPEETPDHNAMQVRFLDDDFCKRFLFAVVGESHIREYLEKQQQEILASIEREKAKAEAEAKRFEDSEPGSWGYEQLLKAHRRSADSSWLQPKVSAPLGDLFCITHQRSFEDRGVDVMLEMTACSLSQSDQLLGMHDYVPRFPDYNRETLKIEIKPTIGDDYPAVLRQMKRTGSDVLYVGTYTGVGAAREQFVETMATADIRVVFESDLS
jgi:uncharacterized protein (DUF3820 family)